jgi:hypothetical protein
MSVRLPFVPTFSPRFSIAIPDPDRDGVAVGFFVFF